MTGRGTSQRRKEVDCATCPWHGGFRTPCGHTVSLQGPRVLHRRDGTNMTASAIVEVVARAARRASLRNNGPHMLRHTFCSQLAMRGAPPRGIQELAGNRDLATTQRYMHLSPAAVQSAIQLLEQPPTAPRAGDILETGRPRSRT